MTEMPHIQIHPEHKVLLDTMNHGIDNEVEVEVEVEVELAISIVSFVASRPSINEVKDALNGVADILHCCLDVDRALQTPEHDSLIDARAYLRELCFSIKRSRLDHIEIDLVFAACPLQLQSDRCWRLGMVVYELVMNSARHAFAGGGGEIFVELFHTGSLVVCRVLDNGAAPAKLRSGRRLRIVNELAKTLDGRFEQQFAAEGSQSVIVFPLPPMRAPAAAVKVRQDDGAGSCPR